MRIKYDTPLRLFIASLLSVICFLLFLIPANAAQTQTTVIMIDNVKDTYQIGEKITATIRVSAPNGAYLTKAWCGFGYNSSTMKQLSETDTQDHLWLTSDTPVKWLTGSIEFEMKANGKAYFIAGAYSGDGVIQAYQADGTRIECPRASVVYKIGTGIYTRTSDCNLSDCVITDKQTGTEIQFNRAFDKNITEYWAEAPASCTELDVRAHVEQNDDTLLLPESLKLKDGENEVKVSVQAISGETKDYVFHITKPETPVAVTDIRITDQDGHEIDYNFDPEKTSYELTVSQDVTALYFDAETGTDTKTTCLSPAELDPGYSFKYIKATSPSEERIYEFYIYRELSSLSLSSLIVDTSDGAAHPFNTPFDPEQTEYEMEVTSDVRKATVSYTVANSSDYVKEDVSEVALSHGKNDVSITVTNGVAEKTYTIHINRADRTVFTYSDADDYYKTAHNTREHVGFKFNNLLPLAIFGVFSFVAIAVFAVYHTVVEAKDYKKSAEAVAIKAERERKKRIREAERQMKKEKEKREKGDKKR